MRSKIFLSLALLLSISNVAFAASKNIMVTGFWNPSNEMLRRLSTDPVKNPEGWIGRNWKNSGYDVHAFFPEYPNGGSVGVGDFQVDWVPVYNDFMRITELLRPIAILSFGLGAGPWEIESALPNNFGAMLDAIAPRVSPLYPIPASLRKATKYSSSLPTRDIKNTINATGSAYPARIDSRGPGSYICGFMGAMIGWYHSQHSRASDPNYNAMGGFIHVSGIVAGTTIDDMRENVYLTLDAMVAKLP